LHRQQQRWLSRRYGGVRLLLAKPTIVGRIVASPVNAVYRCRRHWHHKALAISTTSTSSQVRRISWRIFYKRLLDKNRQFGQAFPL